MSLLHATDRAGSGGVLSHRQPKERRPVHQPQVETPQIQDMDSPTQLRSPA